MKKNGLMMCRTNRMCCCRVIDMMGRRSENDKQHIYNKRHRKNEKDIIHHSIYLAVAS